jgi:hypothetical protein
MPHGTNVQYPMNRRLGGPGLVWKLQRREESLSPAGTKCWIVQPAAQSHYTA